MGDAEGEGDDEPDADDDEHGGEGDRAAVLAALRSVDLVVLFGDDDLKIQGLLQGAYIVVMLLVGQQLALSGFYYFGLLIAAGLFVYQQHLSRHREPKACLRAFLNNHYVGLAIFSSLVLHYLLAGSG